ncbi:type III secretion system needle filament subunit SctF [Serratia quinivorans]|uniref:type III secretion system needle filament subunit SctF n=1 Tax=Serratia quinivorans TaxID=137545 RepID=UPI00217A8290|nr:type III secretion system needle filament subunit SctF [Serratia quinivorans]CAI1010055.1 type III secretion system needle protein SsaG [Serratia quinivorans]CAI1810423.1 type III secretion system needle protein SsaG [Serratia quinivorans]
MDLNLMISQLERLAANNAGRLEEKMDNIDINDPQAMLKMQFAIQQYSSLVNYQSSLVKTVRDLVSGIISKI